MSNLDIDVEEIKVLTFPYIKPIYYNTLQPYQVAPHLGIQYNVCRDFDHISRYKGLRQLAHSYTEPELRYVTLETPNSISLNADCNYYDVPLREENRLDLISQRFYGTPNYCWVIAYINGISDGYIVREGQRLRIPKTITSLFNKGQLLAPIPPLALNLGTE